ncbi:response regulator transcription factor [Flavobacterium sp. W20_MBD1_R3]|uniref:response regulator transcription factor n=1 Tax=Flavobacterium sp. W20_MBD1_R3 TaxID=3240278 RepID=UPI003F91DE56
MPKILIIDDEVKLRETISELFSFSGYDVHEAENGVKGLHKVKKIKPNLIICDVMMPVLCGYGFLEQHKKSDYFYIPVILLTALADSKQEQKGISLGAALQVKKPFGFQELKKIVDSLLLTNNCK